MTTAIKTLQAIKKKRPEKKYIVLGGTIQSQSDGQTHHLNATVVARLYKVPLEECILVHDYRFKIDQAYRDFLLGLQDCKVLEPDETGTYQVPEFTIGGERIRNLLLRKK